MTACTAGRMTSCWNWKNCYLNEGWGKCKPGWLCWVMMIRIGVVFRGFESLFLRNGKFSCDYALWSSSGVFYYCIYICDLAPADVLMILSIEYCVVSRYETQERGNVSGE